MRKRTKVLIAAVAGLGAAAVFGPRVYFELVKKGWIKYNEYDRREQGRLRVGDAAPDLELTLYDGSSLRLSSLWGDGKPLFLVFGSCT